MMSATDLLGRALLARAHNAIGSALGAAARPEPAHTRLAERGATFVTLRLSGELRGCIGTLEPHRPLDDDVRANARAAAFHDPRFAPLALREFAAATIEVSLLQAAQPLVVADEAAAVAALQPHVDGVILSWHGSRATFLPQVWETIGDAREFLRLLKRKAGLPADFWATDLRLARYAVEKFIAEPEVV
jgi:AmmeMemoRadiSam system protein A